LVPSVISFVKNRGLAKQTEAVSAEARGVDWKTAGSPTEKIDKLDHLREHAELLDLYRVEGPPISYTWFMYQGDKLREPTLDQHIDILKQGFVVPVKDALEAKLKRTTGANYLEEYNNLKTYLLLNDRLHLNEVDAENTALSAWETARLTYLWADMLRAGSGG